MIAVLIMGQCNVNVGADGRSSILSPHAFVVVLFGVEYSGVLTLAYSPLNPRDRWDLQRRFLTMIFSHDSFLMKEIFWNRHDQEQCQNRGENM